MAVLHEYGIFISYRRSDTGPYARLLKVQLGQHVPGTPVFMDLDSIEVGTDFAEAIQTGVQSCRILIALIGAQWLTICDEDGNRRLDDPDDYVRFEIRTALERHLRVIPVLVDGAKMPRRGQLPDDLGALTRLNALQMSYDRYEYDESRLMTIIQKALAAGADAAEEPAACRAGSPGGPATALAASTEPPTAGGPQMRETQTGQTKPTVRSE